MTETNDTSARSPTRGDATREALLQAAMDIFGRDGFHAASTRAIAEAAGVNQSLIGYHFRGKQGIYLAVFEHIAGRMQELIGPLVKSVEQELDAAGTGPAARERCRAVLGRAVDGFVAILSRKETDSWARLILREQQEPSEAFDVLYGGIMGRTLGLFTRLVAHIRGHQAVTEQDRLTALTIMGQALVFRAARAAALRHLDWSQIGDDQVAAIQSAIRENLTAMLGKGGRR